MASEKEELYARQEGLKRHDDPCYVLDVEQLVVQSSWLVVNGDVCTIEGRRANGKKKGPRKKRGKPMTTATRQEQQRRAQRAQELRRGGFAVGGQDV